MPIYEAECKNCQSQFEYVSSVANCMDVPRCGLCNSESRKVILSPAKGYVTGKFEAFKSTIDGTLISTNRDLQEHNRRNNVVNLNEVYTDEEIKAGKPAEKKKVDNKKEILNDIQEAVHQVKNGYKPTIGTEDD